MELIGNDEKVVCIDALETFGNAHQINKAKEELDELKLELDRLESSPERTSERAIRGEIADVMIVCQQLAFIYDEEKVKDAIRYKISRLKETIRNYRR